MSNIDIKISVVMPIYNAADFLRAALDSVISQTLKEIEIICVDDGSTDNSLEIIKEYQKNDERVRIVTETNAGPALARNNGIRRVRGEYIAFLDADDFFESTMLEEMYKEAKKNDLDIVICDYDVYNNKKSTFTKPSPADHEEIVVAGGVTSKSDHPNCIFSCTNLSAWNKLFKTSFVVDKNLAFLEEVKMYEDVYFMVTALSLAERVGKVNKLFLHHRVHSEQSRAKSFRKYYSQVPVIYESIKEFLMHNGMYSPLETSFRNLSASRCFKIYNILGSDEKSKFWGMLHGEYAEKLGWHGCSIEDFEDIEVCEFIANIEIYDHKQYKKRCSKGLTLRMDRLGRVMKGAKRRNKVRGFFARIFLRKKTEDK